MSSFKAGIYYTNFAPIFVTICRPDNLIMVAEHQSQSADFGKLEITYFTENCVLYNSMVHDAYTGKKISVILT